MQWPDCSLTLGGLEIATPFPLYAAAFWFHMRLHLGMLAILRLEIAAGGAGKRSLSLFVPHFDEPIDFLARVILALGRFHEANVDSRCTNIF
jgi:hypothetical protein